MKTIYAKHPPYTDGHLAEVADVMQHAGDPTIRAVERDGVYFALEGSHRLFLAHKHGLTPKLVLEREELPDYAAEHWERVAVRLPRYDFPTVLTLDLRS